MIDFIVFLAFLVPGTEIPTLALVRTFNTATECNEFRESNIPVDKRDNWTCMKVEMKAANEREVKKI